MNKDTELQKQQLREDLLNELVPGQDESQVGDVYDILLELTKVATKGTGTNSDYMLSDLQPGLYYNGLTRYIRRQQQLIILIKMMFPENQCKQTMTEIERILQQPMISTIHLSRARNGQILKGFLEAARHPGEAAEPPQEPKQGILSRLLNAGKGTTR